MKTLKQVLKEQDRKTLDRISMLFHTLEEEIPGFDVENTSIDDLWIAITDFFEENP